MVETQKNNASSMPEATQFFEEMANVSAKAQQMMMDFVASTPANLGMISEPEGIMRSATSFWETLTKAWASADPMQLIDMQKQWVEDAMSLWGGFASGEKAEIKDRRFSGEAWEEVPVFDLVRRSYLLASDYLTRSLDAFPGLDDDDRDRLRFQAKQFIDAMSPSNFAALNPEVLAEAQATNGQSLINGLTHMLADLKRGQITMTDESVFEVGVNVAATPGKVVFENRMFQLIQYTPTTDKVHEIPIVFFPPWINKYYILDLTDKKSLIRWLVEQGFTVFVVSWKQASAEHSNIIIDDYVKDGMETAIETVREICGVKSVHTVGYCVAGTTLSAALAYFEAKGKADMVKTATFFTAQVDFTEAGELLNFITPEMIGTISRLTEEKGYLDGRWLAVSFNLLRPTDLMWNYVVNNYLKGQKYKPFDLLYWNSDPTNVPGTWFLAYLHDFYKDNLLVQPGGISIDNVPIDLKKVKTPLYIQAGRDDHIAPAVSCYKLTRAFSSPYRFILAGSGHIAGVINPPSAKKYQYWSLADDTPVPDTLNAFLEQASETPGSWWGDWNAWLSPQSGKQVKAREPGSHPDYPAIEPAPGRYVRERVSD